MGDIPNRQIKGGVVCWDGSPTLHTRWVEKILGKKFGGYMFLFLPLAGWVGLSI